MIKLAPFGAGGGTATAGRIKLSPFPSTTIPQFKPNPQDITQLALSPITVPLQTAGTTTQPISSEPDILSAIVGGVKSTIEHPIVAAGGAIQAIGNFALNVSKGFSDFAKTTGAPGADKVHEFLQTQQNNLNDIAQANLKDKSEETANAVGQFVGSNIPYIIGGEAVSALGTEGAIGALSKFGGGLTISTVSKIGTLTRIASNAAGFIGVDQLAHTPEEGSRAKSAIQDLLVLGVLEGAGSAIGAYKNIKAIQDARSFLSQVRDTKMPLADVEKGIAEVNAKIELETGKTPQELLPSAIDAKIAETPPSSPEIKAPINPIEEAKTLGYKITDISNTSLGKQKGFVYRIEKGLDKMYAKTPEEVASLTGQNVPAISPSLQPLAAEARKYGSAEEFVKAIHDSKSSLMGNFGEQYGVVDESILPKSNIRKVGGQEAIADIKKFIQGDKSLGEKLASATDHEGLGRFYKEGKLPPIIVEQMGGGKIDIIDGQHRLQALRELGIKKIEIASISDTNQGFVKGTSQLTDFYNQATKGGEKLAIPEVLPKATEPVKVSRSQLPVGAGGEKVSRLEARLKDRLNALSPEERAGLSTYNEMNKADQIKMAAEYVSKNPEEAMAVLRGEKPAPKGLLHNSIFLAMEEQANADSELALKLASLRSTRAGQEISILTERDPNSPVKYMTDLANSRIEILGGREKLATLKNQEMASVKRAISKSNIAKTDWDSFIDSISC